MSRQILLSINHEHSIFHRIIQLYLADMNAMDIFTIIFSQIETKRDEVKFPDSNSTVLVQVGCYFCCWAAAVAACACLLACMRIWLAVWLTEAEEEARGVGLLAVGLLAVGLLAAVCFFRTWIRSCILSDGPTFIPVRFTSCSLLSSSNLAPSMFWKSQKKL